MTIMTVGYWPPTRYTAVSSNKRVLRTFTIVSTHRVVSIVPALVGLRWLISSSAPLDVVISSVVTVFGLWMMFLGFRPVRLLRVGSETILQSFTLRGWRSYSLDNAVEIRYLHPPLALRGLARLELRYPDGVSERPPGFVGRMFLGDSLARPSRRIFPSWFPLIGTVTALRLVQEASGRQIDTRRAQWFAVARSE